MSYNVNSSKRTKALKLARQAQEMITEVIKLIEQEEALPAIIQQADRVCGFMTGVRRELLKEYLNACLQTPLIEYREKVLKELLKIYKLTDQLRKAGQE